MANPHPNTEGLKPFEKGNTAPLKHGIRSPAVRTPMEEEYAKQIQAALTEQLGDRVFNPVIDKPLVDRLAADLTTVELGTKFFAEHDPEEMGDRNYNMFNAALNRVPGTLDKLGMSPTARAKLKVNTLTGENLWQRYQQGQTSDGAEKPRKGAPCTRCGAPGVAWDRSTGEILCETCRERLHA